MIRYKSAEQHLVPRPRKCAQLYNAEEMNKLGNLKSLSALFVPLGLDYSTEDGSAADLRFSYFCGRAALEEVGALGSMVAVENENIGYPECGCSCGAVLGRIKDEFYVHS